MSPRTSVDHQQAPHGPALAVAGLAALAVQPFLTEIYQTLAALALVSGVAATWLQIYWKAQDRRREARSTTSKDHPRIHPRDPAEAE